MSVLLVLWVFARPLWLTAHGMPVGVNLPPITSDFPYVFKDLFKHSRVWNLDRWAFDQLVMDEDGGYPTKLPSGASVFTQIGQDATYAESGQYVCLYDGQGSLNFELDATVLQRAPGRILLQVVPAVGIRVRLTSTNASDYVRNIRLLRAADEATYSIQPFSPVLLSLLSGFDIIRFARVQGMSSSTCSYPTNAEKAQYWWQRRKVSAQTQVTAVSDSGSYRTSWRNGESVIGLAVDHMVQLVNLLGADMWVSSPLVNLTKPDDDFAKGLATYIRNNIHAGATVYCELGDNDGSSSNAPNVQQTLLAEKVWRGVWAAGNIGNSQLKFVAHAAAYWPNQFIAYGANLSRMDAIADDGTFATPTTPFAQRSFAQNYSDMTVDQVMDILARAALEKEFLLTENLHRVRSKPVTDQNNNLSVLASNGGAWLQAPTYAARDANTTATNCLTRKSFPCTLSWPYRPERGEAAAWDSWVVPDLATLSAAMASINLAAWKEQRLEDLLIEAATNPRMFGIFFDFLRRWDRLGGGAYVAGDLWYKPIRTASKLSGSQGLLEHPLYTSQAAAPKLAAVRAFIAYKANPAAAPAGALPFTSADWPASPPQSASCKSPCIWGTCFKGKCECFNGVSGEICNQLNQHQDNKCHSNVTMGIVVNGLADWSRQKDFVDQMKRSRGWISNCQGPSCAWGAGPPISWSASKDYPAKIAWGQVLGAMMLRDVETTMDSGTYVVLYDGDGVFRFSNQYDTKEVRRAPGRIEVEVQLSLTANNGIYLELLWTNENNPVRNIRVLPKQYEERHASGDFPFYPSFLYTLRKLRVIRFMEWMKTNTVQDVSDWSSRPTPSNARTYGSVDPLYRGERDNMVPVESMVLLANTIGAHPWFNIPHLASNEWVRSFATLVRDTLRPDLDVYVEYSNEVWHTGFPAGQYAQQQGLAMGLALTHTYWYGDAAEARHCFLAWKTANISAIFEEVFRGRSRLHVIVAAQQILPLTSDKILSCKDAYKKVEHLAVSAYWSGLNVTASLDKNMEVYLPRGISDMKALLLQHNAVAAKYNVSLVGYEVGASMQAGTSAGPSTDLAIATHRDVRVRPLASAAYQTMLDAGMSTLIQYSFAGVYSRYGSFPILEASNQHRLRAPKFLALEDFLAAHRVPSCSYDTYNSCPGGGNCSNYQGQCLPNGQCDCFQAFSGTACQDANLTAKYDCGYQCTFEQGSCNRTVVDLVQYVKTYTCDCKPGFSGPTCALFTCQNACSFAGECVDLDVCSCFPGFTGFWCEVDCGCQGHGVCKSDNSCSCDDGWRWNDTTHFCELSCPCDVCSAPGVCGCAPGNCKYGDCVGGGCTCWEGVSGSDCSILTPASRTNAQSTVGVDVGGLSYWSTAWAFVDVAKQAEAVWTSNCLPDYFSTLDANYSTKCKWGNGMVQDLRPDGYPSRLQPGQSLGRLMVRNVGLRGVSGRYVVLYDGEGRLDFSMDSKIVSRAFGRLEIDVTLTSYPVCENYYEYGGTASSYCGDNGIWVNIVQTNPQNPLRNIRVVMPGFEATYLAQPFHPWYVRALLPFSTLRFMGWQNTNANPAMPHAFEERTLPTSMAQTSAKGAALEYVVQLCNIVAANCWLNLPHWASDEYVRRMAALVKQTLRPDVKVYVEYSNEVWNMGFPAFSYAKEQGIALNYHLNPPAELSWMGSNAAAAAAAYRFQAHRHVQIARLWRDEFGAEAGDRLFFVLSTWTMYASTTATFAQQLVMEGVVSGGSGLVHAIGVAGYFCGEMGYNNQKATTQSMSIQDILTQCGSQASVTALSNSLQAHKTAIAALALPLITYEAGPSLMESSVIQSNFETVALTQKFIAVNRDAAMESVYDAYLAAAGTNGLMSKDRPYMHYSFTGRPSRYGSWSALEFTGQDHLPTSYPAPKYKSLMKLASPGSNPPRSCIRSFYGAVSGARISVHAPSTYGQPGVLTPGPDTYWILGQTGEVRWDVSWAGAADPNAKLDIWLWKGANCDASMREFNASKKAQQAVKLATGVLRASGNALVAVPQNLLAGPYFLEVVGASNEQPGTIISQGNFSSIFAIVARYVWEVQAGDGQGDDAVSCMPNQLLARAARPAVAPFCSLSMGAGCVSDANTARCPKWSVVVYAETGTTCLFDSVGCRNYRTARTGYRSSFKPVRDCTALDSPKPALVRMPTPPAVGSGACQAKVSCQLSLTLPDFAASSDAVEAVLLAVQTAVSVFLGLDGGWVLVELLPADGSPQTAGRRLLSSNSLRRALSGSNETQLGVLVSVVLATTESISAVLVAQTLLHGETGLQVELVKQSGMPAGASLSMTQAPAVALGSYQISSQDIAIRSVSATPSPSPSGSPVYDPGSISAPQPLGAPTTEAAFFHTSGGIVVAVLICLVIVFVLISMSIRKYRQGFVQGAKAKAAAAAAGAGSQPEPRLKKSPRPVSVESIPGQGGHASQDEGCESEPHAVMIRKSPDITLRDLPPPRNRQKPRLEEIEVETTGQVVRELPPPSPGRKLGAEEQLRNSLVLE